jgi:hypothetical protein
MRRCLKIFGNPRQGLSLTEQELDDGKRKYLQMFNQLQTGWFERQWAGKQ